MLSDIGNHIGGLKKDICSFLTVKASIVILSMLNETKERKMKVGLILLEIREKKNV